MSKFGGSYPAGCSGPPDDDRSDMPVPLEEVFLRLEEAEVEQSLIDAGYQAIYELMALASRECPRCVEQNYLDEEESEGDR